MNPSNPVKTEKTDGRITSEQEINPVQIPHPFNATVKFPPPWARCTVKCPGYARGGMLKFRIDRRIIANTGSCLRNTWCVFRNPGMQKTVVLPLQMCIACFLQQAVTGYRSIYCTAVLNPFVFVTVSVFTFRPTERPDKTEDREERETSVICFKKYPHQESLGLAST